MVTAFRGGGEGTEMANPAGLEAPQTCRGSGCGPNFIANSRVHAETERLNASRSRRDDTRSPPCSRRRTWPPEETPHARTLDPQDPARQIGRASCRERVCQYV